MRSSHSFKLSILQNRRWVKFRYDRRVTYYYRKWPPAALAYILGIVIFTASALVAGHNVPQQPNTGRHGIGYGLTIRLPGGHSLTLQNRVSTIGQSSSSSAAANGSQAQSSPLALTHSNIITTVFWVGEPADGDNGNITNVESTWDDNWEADYGGLDSSTNRNGYLPAGFTPKENPFYFALPYSDIDGDGNRKASATNCPGYPARKNSPYSWCKNSWIAINYNGKTAYAQWEDAGPFGEDDTAYVFGSATPKNTTDAKAGLDVSPAVETYLGLNGENNCSWYFVSGPASGPWTQILSTDLGDNSVN